MATPLDKPLKRELHLGESSYTVTISPLGIRIVPKGKRLGQEITWQDILDGAPQMAAKLRQSLERPGSGRPRAAAPTARPAK